MTASLADDYASRILAAKALVERLGPDRRNPHQFLEDKDAAVQSLQQLADEVQLDQIFAKLPPHPASERGAMPAGARQIRDRRGRPVPVETKRRRSTGAR